jgi:hypothetical protein
MSDKPKGIREIGNLNLQTIPQTGAHPANSLGMIGGNSLISAQGTIPIGQHSGKIFGIDLKTMRPVSGPTWTMLMVVCHLSLKVRFAYHSMLKKKRCDFYIKTGTVSIFPKVWAFAIPGKATAIVVQQLLYKFCLEVLVDVPLCWLSDNGGQFRCLLASVSWKCIWNTRCIFTPKSHPASNSFTERKNGVIAQMSNRYGLTPSNNYLFYR